MRALQKLGLRIRSLLRRSQIDVELHNELSLHIELQVEENIARGMNPEQARYAAQHALGGAVQIEEACRDKRRVRFIENLVKDVAFAFRTFRKAPTFAAVSILTIGLGIGAITAIFTVVDGVILRPLSYPDPDRLVTVWEANSKYPPASIRFSPGNYLELRETNRSFAEVGAADFSSYNLSGKGDPERVSVGRISASFFRILGVNPALGRAFRGSDDIWGAPRAVILSNGLWRQRYGSDTGVLGQSIRLDDQSYAIVGVMPPRVVTLPPGAGAPPEGVDVWVPLESAVDPGDMHWRFSYYLATIARLKPGVTLQQAQQDVDGIVRSINHRFRDDLGINGGTVISMHERTVARARQPLLILLGAVAFVLLIACANVASLSLGHSASRRREIAVRLALGAGRSRVIGQLLTESVVLSLCGAVFGVSLAVWGVNALLRLAPPELPRAADVHIDGWVLVFSTIAATFTGIVCGLLPAWIASGTDVQEDLRDAGRTSSGSWRRSRLRNALVASEMALAFVLMIGAGLMIESFRRVAAVNPGFDPRGLITMRIPLSGTTYDNIGVQARFYHNVLERVGAIRGLTSFGAIDGLPFSEGGFNNMFAIDDGRPPQPPGQGLVSNVRRVDTGYFRTMRIPLLQGRGFTEANRTGSPDVALINQSMARHYWGNGNPVGKHLNVFFGRPTVQATIVGVVGDVRSALDAKPEDCIYVPYPQGRNVANMYLILRPGSHGSTIDSAALVKRVREIVGSLDPSQPVYRVRTMDELLAASLATRRFEMVLLGIFAALAACLAAIGMFGVLGYSVQVRTREIGIRTALGAQRKQVFNAILRDALRLALLGLGAGLCLAFGLTRLLSSLLYGVKPTDSATWALVSLFLLLISMFAAYVPASRATRIDPITALRNE